MLRFSAPCFPNPGLHHACHAVLQKHALTQDLAHHVKCAHHPPCRHASLIAQMHVDADAAGDAAQTAAVAKTSGLPDGVAAAAVAGKHAGQSWGGLESSEVGD